MTPSIYQQLFAFEVLRFQITPHKRHPDSVARVRIDADINFRKALHWPSLFISYFLFNMEIQESYKNKINNLNMLLVEYLISFAQKLILLYLSQCEVSFKFINLIAKANKYFLFYLS